MFLEKDRHSISKSIRYCKPANWDDNENVFKSGTPDKI